MPINQDSYRHTHLTSHQIMTYLTQQYTEEENHAIEEHLLNCDLCNDAVEGYETMNVREIDMDLQALEKRQKAYMDEHSFNFKPLMIAASAALLMVSMYFGSEYYMPWIQSADLAMITGFDKEMADQEVHTVDSLGYLQEFASQSFADESETEERVAIAAKEETKSEPKPAKQRPSQQQSATPVQEENQIEGFDEEEEPLYAVVDEIDDFEEVVLEENLVSANDVMPAKSMSAAPAQQRMSMSIAKKQSVQHVFFGQVTTADDAQGLAGATVVLKDGTNAGTVTDADGYFEIQSQKSVAPVSVSFIGYETKQINATAGNQIDVVMVQNMEVLSDKVMADQSAKKSVPEVRVDPVPVSGMKAYLAALQEKLVYPQTALDNQVQGVVGVTFTITEDAAITHIKITKSLDKNCDEEAIRLVGETGAWKPGTINGTPKALEVSISIEFKLP